MELGLEGRVALVMGASQGIGKAIAAALAREGARVAIASRSRERLEEAAAEIGEVAVFEADATDSEGWRGCRWKSPRRWGRRRSWC